MKLHVYMNTDFIIVYEDPGIILFTLSIHLITTCIIIRFLKSDNYM